MVALKIPVNITDPTACITTYFADLLERLDAMGYGEFKTDKPKTQNKAAHSTHSDPHSKSALQERIKIEAGFEKTFVSSSSD